MRILLCIALLAFSTHVYAETTSLALPNSGKLSFDVPPMKKIKEVSGTEGYQYLASSLGYPDERFNLSAFIEQSTCHFGNSTKQITRCFLEKTDAIPGIIAGETRTECTEEIKCVVIYAVAGLIGERAFRQLHLNVLFAYRGGSGHVHLSITSPTDDDVSVLTQFLTSVAYE